MPEDEYGQLAAEVLAAGEKWSQPLLASLLSRRLYLALFKECLRAAHERSDHGTRFELREDEQADQFALIADSRCIRFERFAGHAVVAIHREGFPPELVPAGLGSESVEAPMARDEVMTLARQQVNMALRLLFRRTD